jgi:hypothetical protein
MCASVLACMISCVSVHDFMWMCACELLHDLISTIQIPLHWNLVLVLWFYAEIFGLSVSLSETKTLAYLLCLITPYRVSISFIFAPLFEIRDFTKTLSPLTQKFSNLVDGLLALINHLWANHHHHLDQNLNLSKFKQILAKLIIYSSCLLSFPLSLQNRPRMQP